MLVPKINDYVYGKQRIAKIQGNNVEYYTVDHLGNTRVTYTANATCTPPLNGNPAIFSLQHTVNNVYDYFPYGKILRSYVGSEREKYLFTGKERDKETELDYFEARFLDTDIGIFRQVDAMADAMPSWTPYRYAFCNPVMFIDPNGNLETDFINKKTGEPRWSGHSSRPRITLNNTIYLVHPNDGYYLRYSKQLSRNWSGRMSRPAGIE